ncbi:MAG TPA: hypothetical protein VGL12_10175 [Roseiarcus sp.]
MAAGAPVRNIVAAVVGHVLEFYDFTIFASCSGVLPGERPVGPACCWRPREAAPA